MVVSIRQVSVNVKPRLVNSLAYAISVAGSRHPIHFSVSSYQASDLSKVG